MSAAIAIELEQVERRSQVVELAKTGKSYRVIGSQLGVNASTVARDIAAWAAETKPSAEQTEDLRKLQHEQILGLREKLYARLESDDYLAVTDRLVKLMDREAKLMGLDLQPGIQVAVLTRESLAAFLWDASASVEAIEGTATEITDGG